MSRVECRWGPGLNESINIERGGCWRSSSSPKNPFSRLIIHTNQVEKSINWRNFGSFLSHNQLITRSHHHTPRKARSASESKKTVKSRKETRKADWWSFKEAEITQGKISSENSETLEKKFSFTLWHEDERWKKKKRKISPAWGGDQEEAATSLSGQQSPVIDDVRMNPRQQLGSDEKCSRW